MNLKHNVINSTWWTPMNRPIGFVQGMDASACIGAVAIKTYGGWKAYIGYGVGIIAKLDEQNIAKCGAKLTEPEARGIFPQYSNEKYIS